jgi:hypothetical protein
MVFWVIAKPQGQPEMPAVRAIPSQRIGPFENRDMAAQAREEAVRRQPPPPGTKLEIVCDFS